MPIAPTQAPAALRITRTFAASRERVFRAWTEPRALAHWFVPTGECKTTVVELDTRAGGRYRLEMRIGERDYASWGVFQDLVPPERLSFTWQWDDTAAGGDAGDSLVTIELFDKGGVTELVLTQERFPSEKSRTKHTEGWNGCLNSLEALLSERRSS